MKKITVSFFLFFLMNCHQIFSAERESLESPLICKQPPAEYPSGKIGINQAPQDLISSTSSNTCCTKNLCKHLGSSCALIAATSAPLIASMAAGTTVGIVPSLDACADHWASQLEEVRRCQCCCMTTTALIACLLFWPCGYIDTCCIFRCGYAGNLGIGSCGIGGRIFGICSQKLSCTRQVGRSTGSLLGKVADKLNSCLPQCLRPQTISDYMEERFGITWRDEEEAHGGHAAHLDQEARVQAGLSVLERSLIHKLQQIRSEEAFADFIARIEQLLHKIEVAKAAHAADGCEAILQEHVQLAEDINQATIRLYQQAQQTAQTEVQELRGTIAEHAVILRALQQRLQREAATPASPITAAEYVVVHGGGESPERDGGNSAGVAEDTHSKSA